MHRIGARSGVLFAALGAVLALAVIAGTVFLCYSIRKQTFADRRRELENLSLTLAEQSDRAFQSLQLVQKSIIERIAAANIESQTALGALMSTFDINETLREKISGLPFVDAVTIIDQQGNLLNFSRYWPVPSVNVSDRDYFIALRDSRNKTIYVSQPVPNRGTGTMTIYLANRFNTPSGAFFGLVLGAMEQSYFEQFYGAIKLGRDGNITLFREDGAHLASFPHRSLSQVQLPQSATRIARELIAEEPEDGIVPAGLIDEHAPLVAVQQLANYPLVVAVSDTTDAIEARLRLQIRPIGIAAGLICIAIGVAVALAIRQSQAQARFAAAAHHTAPGMTTYGPAEPPPLHRAPDRPACHHALTAGGAVPRSRLLQDGQRHARPCGGRPVAAGGRDPRRRGGAAERTGGPARRRRIRHHQQPGRPAGSRAGAGRADHRRISRPISVEDHRVIAGGSVGIAMAPRGRHVGDRAPEECGPRPLSRQGGRAGTGAPVRAGDGAHRAVPPLAGARPAQRLGERTVLPRLPALLPRRGPQALRLRGAAALAPSDAGHRRPRHLHRLRGRDRPHPAARRLGAHGSLPRGGRLPDDVRLAVNLSPLQFRSGHMPDQIREALRVSGLKPSRLELELTESTLLEEGSGIHAPCRGLRSQGSPSRSTISAPATSSLSYLRSLPIDRIKIDRGFISRICEDDPSRAIVRAVLQLSAALKLETTAEGIETEEQLETLRPKAAAMSRAICWGGPCAPPRRGTCPSRP